MHLEKLPAAVLMFKQWLEYLSCFFLLVS